MIVPCNRRGEVVCSGDRVGGKEGYNLCSSEVYCSKSSYNLVGGVNWLRDNKIGSWPNRSRTSNKEFNPRRTRADGKTDGTS